MILPPDVQAVLSRLHGAGFAAYAVGGCVRDALRGTAPADWDVTTAALPDEVEKLFFDRRLYTVGKQHGTVAVIEADRPIEITTFRTDGDYSDCRRPDEVTFVKSLAEDLKRRDLTVNAMAYCEEEGLIDLFGGEQDLLAGRLRAVGDPETRFSEDALRILRTLRFASVLGFSIEDATAKALFACRDLLFNIAPERIYAELTRLLCGENAFSVLRDYRDIIAVVLPEIAPMFDFEQRTPFHIYDVYTHTLHAVETAPPDPTIRWALLLHDIGKPDAFTMDEQGVAHFKGHDKISAVIADSVMRRLRAPSETVAQIEELVRLHDRPLIPTPPAVKRVLGKIGEEQFWRLCEVKRADNAAHAPIKDGRVIELERAMAVADEILRANACFSLKDLAVNGQDILALGVAPSKEVGMVLQALLDDVINDVCENERKALLARATCMIKEARA